jgi:hypothetical protein
MYRAQYDMRLSHPAAISFSILEVVTQTLDIYTNYRLTFSVNGINFLKSIKAMD